MEQSSHIKALDHVAGLIEEAHELRRALATERALREKRERQLVWAVKNRLYFQEAGVISRDHLLMKPHKFVMDWDQTPCEDDSDGSILIAIDEATGELD